MKEKLVVKDTPLIRGSRKKLFTDWDLYLLLLPGLLFFIIFKYAPMWGISLAFQDYSPFLGFWQSDWVGFDNFVKLFTYDKFWQIFRNTLVISFYNIIFFFPTPIILALLLNEIKNKYFKKTIQTVIYLPHFISWVVVVSMTILFFGSQDGLVNSVITGVGGEPVTFLTNPNVFRTMIVGQNIWIEAVLGTIIHLAALSVVD